ncbi:MAG: hypothetical protein WC002_07560 [Candidatus Muiribacteriota bacterium]
MKKILLSFMLIVFATAGLAADVTNQRLEYLEKSALLEIPTYTLEKLWQTIEVEEKLFITEQVGKHLKTYFPANFPSASRTAQASRSNLFTEEEKQYMNEMAEFLDCFPEGTPDRGLKKYFINKALDLLEKMDKNKLARLNPAILKYYHNVISFSLKDKIKTEFTPDYPGFKFKNFTLVSDYKFKERNEGDFDREIPQSNFSSMFQLAGTNREIGTLLYIVEYPDSVKYNSILLADVLNQLSNYNTKGAYQPVTFHLNGTEHIVKNGEDLIELFYNHDDYDITLFEARTLLSFGGFALKNDRGYYPIEFPFYMKVNPDNKTSYVPMNHTEHLLTIYNKNQAEPLAIVKWYSFLGPDKNYDQGTYYAPALIGRSQWPGYKITHVYNKKENLVKFVQTAREIQKLFNYIQDAYQFPNQGYGVLAVCNDATSIMEAALTGDGTKVPIPNFRHVKFDELYTNILGYLNTGLKLNSAGYLNVFSDVYPEANERHSIKDYERLYLNIPFRSLNGAKGFRTGEVLEDLIRKSPSNTEYLNHVYFDTK